jgi:N6-L-threonylcarbamoyladenine synthase
MRILGIETSCDETGAAVVEDGREVRSNILVSQEDLHRPYGGVVPELACRRHVTVIEKVVARALETARIGIGDLDAIAVTRGPGLMGALLVGVSFAKAMAYRLRRPLIGINHLEGHMAAIRLEGNRFDPVPFPMIALVVSGGHTNLYLMESFRQFTPLGRTLDDAAGEAFDKGAKMLGLGFPGGPVMDRVAKEGDPAAIAFPRPYSDRDNLDFSFSGLKTALRYYLEKQEEISPSHRADIAASFQQAIVDVLVSKSLRACTRFGANGIMVAGGVAANSVLRAVLKNRLEGSGRLLAIPRPSYCTDNGAMIAAAAHPLEDQRLRPGLAGLFSMTAEPRLILGDGSVLSP